MVVIQTMVNTLACTNQAIFHLLVLQAVDSSFWHGTVYSHVKVLRGCVEVYSTVYMQMHDGEIAQEFKGALFPYINTAFCIISRKEMRQEPYELVYPSKL